MPIIFRLSKILHRYSIQQIELAKESNTRPATISQMCRNDIKRVNTEMLNRVIPALERLTRKKHSLEDIMPYIRDNEPHEEGQIISCTLHNKKQTNRDVSQIKYTLADTLMNHKISQYELAKQSKTRETTISQLCRGEVIRVNIEMLNRIISTLDQLTGEKHTLKDVMTYVHNDD